ncbi:MAG: hypothetical protein KDC87_08725 [Planctomycetes bacterium]|nr:hypothetical protein [Planctomycetota bacterium]MCB9888476.1 hypothetical protein [Planctomycetota bacterium]
MMKVLPYALPAVALLGVVQTLSAQKDVIEWMDGTVTRAAKVTAYDAKEIKFRASGSEQQRAAHEVKNLNVESWNEAFGKAGNKSESLIGEARAVVDKNPFLAQAVYKRAADILASDGSVSDALRVLEEIDQKLPTSAYAPDYHRRKIEYYLSRPKPALKDAASAAQKYLDAARTRSWSRAYELDAQLWEIRIKAAQPKASRDTYIGELKELVGKAQGTADGVAAAAQVHLADAYRAGKDYANAKKLYQTLADKKGLDGSTRARIYLGLGYLASEEAVVATKPEQVKESHHEAFKRFLQVFLNTRETANPELVGEGLYNAAKACEQWGGLPTCGQMAGRLRYRLKYRAPWKDTSWARKR